MKYIAKPDTWFDEGTEVKLITDYRSKGYENFPISLFEGWRTCENPVSENRIIGEKYLDQEDCSWDEFEMVDDKNDKSLCDECNLNPPLCNKCLGA